MNGLLPVRLALRPTPLVLAAALLALSPGCAERSCTEIGCESTIIVDYGDVTVSEPYSLTINPGGQSTTVTCLMTGPDAEPLPEWIECDANGFELTGAFSSDTTITVAVVPLSTQEAVISNALVPLTVAESDQPNGPDCDPVCYTRVGSTAGL